MFGFGLTHPANFGRDLRRKFRARSGINPDYRCGFSSSGPTICAEFAQLGVCPSETRGVNLHDALAARIESPEALISWTELGRAMVFVVVTVVRTAWWAALKFALCNVLAYGGFRVLGYVLPILRFFSEIPW